MKNSRKVELFDKLFEFIAQNHDNATDILFKLGMTTNEIDDCADVEYCEDD